MTSPKPKTKTPPHGFGEGCAATLGRDLYLNSGILCKAAPGSIPYCPLGIKYDGIVPRRIDPALSASRFIPLTKASYSAALSVMER